MKKDQKQIPSLSNGLWTPNTQAISHADGPENREQIIERYTRERDLSKVSVLPPKPELNPFDMHQKKRVVIYCRVSTDGLSQATSFVLQKRYYLKYVQKRPDWQLIAIYSDEGLTATQTRKRIGLLKMLQDAKNGLFDIIIVKNLSRLSRNLMDCMDIIYKLRRLPKPVGIYFESENMFTLDKNIDFTLQILSLVAQEESHKKSEAMNASNAQRNANAQFTKPALLGYDRIGVNEIGINPEEAKTVQAIYLLFMAGFSLQSIAEIMTMTGRKTHTHVYKDGRIKEGIVHWTADSIKNILTNERRCGCVLAPKTQTPNYLDHVSVPIRNSEKLQYFAVDQHDCIVSPDDFMVTQRLLSANSRGWNFGIPQIYACQSGILNGFVSTAPNWRGFSSEDYNRTALRAVGMTEAEIQEIEAQIEEDLRKAPDAKVPLEEYYNGFHSISADDFEKFDGESEAKEKEEGKPEEAESFLNRVNQRREKLPVPKPTRTISNYDFSRAEVARSLLFSVREKACITLDAKGITFNKNCLNKISGGKYDVEDVNVSYDPIRQLLVVHTMGGNEQTLLHWMKVKENGTIQAKRCPANGLTDCIYTNMEWNRNSRFRMVAEVEKIGDETLLVFDLTEYLEIVPLYQEEKKKKYQSRKRQKPIVRDGYDAETDFIVESANLEDDTRFSESSSTEQENALSNTAKSRAIYYDNLLKKDLQELTVADLGDKKYSAETIAGLMNKGIAPVDGGWSYLKGMAHIYKSSFTIFPAEWAGKMGRTVYENESRKLNSAYRRVDDKPREIKLIPFGWTMDLKLPTKAMAKKVIKELMDEKVMKASG